MVVAEVVGHEPETTLMVAQGAMVVAEQEQGSSPLLAQTVPQTQEAGRAAAGRARPEATAVQGLS
jgi:hypothetical protein